MLNKGEVKVLVAQLCPTLCDSLDCSQPGSSVQVILQARILEWVAIPFSGDLPDSGIEPTSPSLPEYCLLSEPPEKPLTRCSSQEVLRAGAIGQALPSGKCPWPADWEWWRGGIVWCIMTLLSPIPLHCAPSSVMPGSSPILCPSIPPSSPTLSGAVGSQFQAPSSSHVFWGHLSLAQQFPETTIWFL